MPSAFDADFAEAAEMLTEQYAATVTLLRGGRSSEDVEAEQFLQEYGTLDGEGFKVGSYAGCDWLISVAAYVFSGEATEPREGDVIRLSDGTEWEVLPDGNDQAAQLIESGNRWLIHSKRSSLQ